MLLTCPIASSKAEMSSVETLRGESIGGRFARMERGTSFIGVGGSKANCIVPHR